MTDREARFCGEYLIDLDACAAALRAGYPLKRALEAADWLRPGSGRCRPGLCEAVRRAQAERARRTGVTADRVLREYARIAFANLADLVEVSDGVRLKPGLGEDDLAAIAQVKVKLAGDRVVEADVKLYRVTDSMGLSAQRTGTFTAYAYAPPSLSGFSVTRYKTILSDQGAIDVPADDGVKIWISLAGATSAVANKNAWTLRLLYGALDDPGRTAVNVAAGSDGRSFAYVADKAILTAQMTATTTFELTMVLTDMLGSVQTVALALKAGGYMHIEKHGVAVGMRTTATASEKKFEVAGDYVSCLYGGIAGVSSYAAGEAETGGRWIDGRPILRAVFTGSATTTGNIDTGALAQAPGVIVGIRGSYYRESDGVHRPLPFASHSGVNWSAGATVDGSGNVKLHLGSSNSGTKRYVIIVEYVPAAI